MTRNGIRVVDLLDDFENFANKFSILADNHMAAFPGLQVSYIKIQYRYFIVLKLLLYNMYNVHLLEGRIRFRVIKFLEPDPNFI